MAIIPKNDYTGRINSTDPEYPQGKAINIIGTTVGTGTPVEEKWLNDDWGFKQEILSEAGITPSGVPDKVGASQYLDGIKTVVNVNDLSQTYTFPTVEALASSLIVFPIGKNLKVKDAVFIVQNETSTIQLSDGKYVKSSSDTVLMSWIDVTGVVNESVKIQQLLDAGFKVRLPVGTIVADINIPDGGVLNGSGAPRYDDTVDSGWDAWGTLLMGSINVANKSSWCIGNLSVDSFDAGGNSLAGTGARTGYGFISNVKTRANNHGHLYETATTFNGAGLDAASDVIGNIVVQDCEHWGGPNGFVTKHHKVKFIRCKTWGVTAQGFVAVSDNINSALVYNRATDSEFEDCYSEGLGLVTGGTEGVRIYTQDRFSADPTNDVNTNNVQPCENTKITNYRYSNLSGYPIRIGDYDNSTVASLNNIETYIDGLRYKINAFGAVLLQHTSNTVVSRSVFGAGANISVTDKASSVIIEDNNISSAGIQTGAETGKIVVNDNAASIEMRHWSPKLTYVFNNTIATTVTGVLNNVRHKPIRLLIDDIYTKINIFSSAINYTGKGTVIDTHFDGTSWIVDRVSNDKTRQEQVDAFSLTQTFDYVSAESFSITTEATADWTQINGNVTGLADGSVVQMYLRAGSATRNIGAWGVEFKFNSTAPTSVGAFYKLIMSFYVRQGNLVEQSRVTYT